jgi:ribose/xylose/arabinose/galactoside ABC-type transport system permease subunit
MTQPNRPGQALVELARRREYGVLALLGITVGVVGIVNPDFLGAGNVRDMLVNASPTLIVACGLTLVIVTGEIDISVGSLMALCAAALGLVSSGDHLGWPVGTAILLTLALGAGVGFVNGLLVTVGRVPSIIVTLGMLTALRGLTDLLMAGEWIKGLPDALRFFGTGSIAGVRVSVLAATLTIALFVLIMHQTPLGRRIYAVGSNPNSARLAGISQARIKLAVFTISGLLTAVAAVVGVTQLGVIEQGVGVGFELLVVTCVVVGGTSISGGRGTIAGSVLGVLLLSMVGTVLIFLRLGPQATYWERAIQGAFILVAVLADHLVRRRPTEARR